MKAKNLFFKTMIIVVFIVVFASIVVLGFYLRKKHDTAFSSTSYYYVYAKKSKKSGILENLQDGLKEKGGAGKIFKREELFYLIVNVYLDEELAKSVAEENKSIYEEVGVLEIKTAKLSRKSKDFVRNDEILFKFIKKLNESIVGVCDMMLDYLAGECSENELCSSVLMIKFDFNDISNENIKLKNKESKRLVDNYLALTLMYYESFFNNFFDSSKKKSLLCDFVVNLTLLKVDLFNNL